MQKRKITLIPITELQTEFQLAIRDIRNDPEVRKVMFTNHVIGVTEHLQWITRLKTDTNKIVFGVVEDFPIGAISLTAFDRANMRSDWGLYLSPKERGRGIGTVVEARFLEFAFETIGLQKLNGTVVEGNEAVVRFYERFGFEKEGFRHSELATDGGRRMGVHFLGLRRESWVQNRAAIRDTCRDLFERFEVEIQWAPETRSLTPIDQIEAARARNNVNWMNILRIAVEKSPANAKQIIAEIRELDQQISTLTAQINLKP